MAEGLGGKRPILVENFDSAEQILLTCLLSAAGLWSDIWPKITMQDQANWWLLHVYGESRWGYFDFDNKASRAKETLRAVAAVNFAFHRVFGAIRCKGKCMTIRTLGDFLSNSSCDEWDFCFECIDPRAPFHRAPR